MARRKVLLLGLDAAEHSLLLEGCDSGWLPTLRSLRDRGAWGLALSPPGFGSGAIWPSFSTGVTSSLRNSTKPSAGGSMPPFPAASTSTAVNA